MEEVILIERLSGKGRVYEGEELIGNCGYRRSGVTH
jgi:hypothetical protein